MPVDRAGILRLRAEEVRTLAESSRAPLARRTLLDIALDYERQAQRLEKAAQCRRLASYLLPGDPTREALLQLAEEAASNYQSH
jgi:hypothetical protein